MTRWLDISSYNSEEHEDVLLNVKETRHRGYGELWNITTVTYQAYVGRLVSGEYLITLADSLVSLKELYDDSLVEVEVVNWAMLPI